jgi:hypothetical protein
LGPESNSKHAVCGFNPLAMIQKGLKPNPWRKYVKKEIIKTKEKKWKSSQMLYPW